MKKVLTLVLLIVVPALAFAQGIVSFGNQTGLVKKWTSASDTNLVTLPRSGGYVQLIAAPMGTPLPNPLFIGNPAAGQAVSPNYDSLASFLGPIALLATANPFKYSIMTDWS